MYSQLVPQVVGPAAVTRPIAYHDYMDVEGFVQRRQLDLLVCPYVAYATYSSEYLKFKFLPCSSRLRYPESYLPICCHGQRPLGGLPASLPESSLHPCLLLLSLLFVACAVGTCTFEPTSLKSTLGIPPILRI